jgi:hypothetical protein
VSARHQKDQDDAFIRGFGSALATVWRCHHDGQMVRHLIQQSNFTLKSFLGVGLLKADLTAIRQAVRR